MSWFYDERLQVNFKYKKISMAKYYKTDMKRLTNMLYYFKFLFCTFCYPYAYFFLFPPYLSTLPLVSSTLIPCCLQWCPVSAVYVFGRGKVDRHVFFQFGNCRCSIYKCHTVTFPTPLGSLLAYIIVFRY